MIITILFYFILLGGGCNEKYIRCLSMKLKKMGCWICFPYPNVMKFKGSEAVDVWMTQNDKTWYYPELPKYILNIKYLSYDRQHTHILILLCIIFSSKFFLNYQSVNYAVMRFWSLKKYKITKYTTTENFAYWL